MSVLWGRAKSQGVMRVGGNPEDYCSFSWLSLAMAEQQVVLHVRRLAGAHAPLAHVRRGTRCAVHICKIGYSIGADV